MSVLIFLVVLFALILVHEWGHFIVAKLTGMRVDEFGIGFPPKLWGVKKGETEYTLNAMPIGGFVRILGENFDESIPESDLNRSFTAKSKWAQVAVLIAGVAMNTIFAWFLFVIILMSGVATAVDETEAGPEAELVAAEVLDDSPAAIAELPAGATILSVSATRDELSDSLTPTSFREFIIDHGNDELSVSYSIYDEVSTVTLTPVTGLVDGSDTPAIGVSLTLVDTVSYSLPSALWQATITTANSLYAIASGIISLFIDIAQFDADLSSVAGPVGIVGLVGEAAEFGIISLLTFTAFISLNLAVINMLPIPALDGGRLLFVAIEAVIRRPINPVWMSRVNLVGFVGLLLLMVAVTFSDIAKLI